MAMRPTPVRTALWAAPFTKTAEDVYLVPGLEEALASNAEAVLFDLEDTVAPAERPARRDRLKSMAHDPRIWVRISSPRTAEWKLDLDAAVAVAGTIIVSKVESAEDLDLVADELRARGSAAQLVALVESGRALSRIHEICAHNSGRLRSLLLGIADMTHDLGMTYTGLGELEMYMRCRLIEASAAAGLEPPLDTSCLFIGDEEFLRKECQTARRMGFGGKLCATLEEVVVVEEEFSPTPQEIENARRIVAADIEAEGSSAGIFLLDGRIIDYPVVLKAKALIREIDR